MHKKSFKPISSDDGLRMLTDEEQMLASGGMAPIRARPPGLVPRQKLRPWVPRYPIDVPKKKRPR